EPREPVEPELERLEQRLLLGPKRPGRLQGLRLGEVLLLLLSEAVELLLEVRLFQPRGRQEIVQLPPSLLRALPDRRHRLHVLAIGAALRSALTALHPEDEQNHDQDRE